MKRALVGYGGHAREVMAQMNERLVCFVEDAYLIEGTLPLSKFNPAEYSLMIAIAAPEHRKRIVAQLPKETQYFTWVHPTAIIMSKDVEIGVGSFIGAQSIITTNVKLGAHALLNRGNQIGHDCLIGDYLSMMPGAILSGTEEVGDCVYLGNNATVREKLHIHSNTTIGMNSAVVKDIKEPGTYVGVPAKKIK